jgi:hypothetical protein
MMVIGPGIFGACPVPHQRSAEKPACDAGKVAAASEYEKKFAFRSSGMTRNEGGTTEWRKT